MRYYLFASILWAASVAGFAPSARNINAPTSKCHFLTSAPISFSVQLTRNVRKASTAVFASSEDSSGNDTSEGIPSSPLDRPVLSAIDATALTIFAGIGKASHSADGSLDIAAIFVTAFPFLVSWFLVSPLVGCFTPEATKDIKSAAVQSAKGWILAVPLGCVLRGVIKGYIPPIPFVVVTLIATLVILTIGRVGYTALSEFYVEMF